MQAFGPAVLGDEHDAMRQRIARMMNVDPAAAPNHLAASGAVAVQPVEELALPLPLQAAETENLPSEEREVPRLLTRRSRTSRSSRAGSLPESRRFGGKIARTSRPAIRFTAVRWSISSRACCATVRPSRKIVRWSASAQTSCIRCVMTTTVVPLARRPRTSSKSRCTSTSPSDDVASSRIRIRGSCLIAFAISTICRRSRGRLETGALTLMSDTPSRSERTSRQGDRHRPVGREQAPPQGQVAQDDVVHHRELGNEGELLVYNGDPRRA